MRRRGPTKMGELERDTYRRECARWSVVRRRAKIAPASSHQQPRHAHPAAGGFGSVRHRAYSADRTRNVHAADAVAAMLMLAKAVDGVEGLAASIATGTPVVAFDVRDDLALPHLEHAWKEVVLRDPTAASAKVDAELHKRDRADFDFLHLFVTEPPIASGRDNARRAALTAISFARPILAFSPLAATYLPDAVLRSCDAKVIVGPPDADIVAATIRIVTGEWPRGGLAPALLERIGSAEIAIAIRFDRTAADCINRLRRLASEGLAKADSRELRLDELFGMDAAVDWGRSLVQDIKLWKIGLLPWSALDTGVCFEGPAGTGKTTVCRVIAAEAGMDLLVTSAARWQSSGEGHLGHYLRAMRGDYEEACRRATRNPVLFVLEECDSITDRNSVTHSHRDYVVQCVNAVLEMMDSLPDGRGVAGPVGIAERPRIVFAGTSNDASRCDPALLRSGRLNRVIRVDLPDRDALEKIFRLRLRGDLADTDLSDLALAAAGCSGADVERMVKDARRSARHDGREIALDDLKRAVAGDAAVPAELLPRIAMHEAGHILVDVLLSGPVGAVATMTPAFGRAAASFRLIEGPAAGTYDDHFRRLQVLFAGRAAEIATFGEPGDGWSGSPGSDLSQASHLAAAMVGSLGLCGAGPLYLGPSRAAPALLAFPEVRTQARLLLKRAETAAARLIARHRAALQLIAERLLADGRIDGGQVAGIVASRGPPAARSKPERLPTTTQKGFA